MKKFLPIFLCVMLFGIGCAKERPEPRRHPEVRVSAAVVEARDMPAVVQSAGTVEAVREATLSAKVMGVIRELRVEEGDRVNNDETLVVIDADDIRAKKTEAEQARVEGLAGLDEARAASKEAKAALDNAGINLSRMTALYSEQAVTKKELDDMTTHHRMAEAKAEQVEAKIKQVEARIAQADAGIRQADVMLGYSVIKSPVDGVVVNKMAHMGEMAAPGMPLVRVVDDSNLRLAATVKEGEAGALKRGAKVDVVVDALGGLKVSGAVSEVVPAADPATRSFVVNVGLPHTPGLLPGMFGRAMLPVGTRRAVVAPADSVVNREGMAGVYVVPEDGIIRFQAVSTGGAVDGGVEILSGLAGGEKVAVGELSGVREGMKAVTK
jgi:RND family efflux transporter MFP subunit